MFHEVTYGLSLTQPFRHNILGLVQRAMASVVCRTAERIFVSTLACAATLRGLARPGQKMFTLPVPSNIPTEVPEEARDAARLRIAGARERAVIGHFGTYAPWIVARLREPLVSLLRNDSGRVALLLGRGGENYAARLCQEYPNLADRILATGGLSGEALAAHLAACDLLLQPYEEGVTCRRGSLMSGLALGLPILTTDGRWTEAIWREGAAVCLVPDGDAAWTAAAEDLLRDQPARRQLARRAAQFYRDHFAIEHTIRALRQTPANS
jgi:glycosyltransferase involved in cell wall biosynthesis